MKNRRNDQWDEHLYFETLFYDYFNWKIIMGSFKFISDMDFDLFVSYDLELTEIFEIVFW